MHTPFNPEQVDWNAFVEIAADGPQMGNGYTTYEGFFQRGSGAGYTYFEGLPCQRGAGIGSVFRSLYRMLLPLGKAAAGAVGTEGIATASRILNNAMSTPEKNWRENIAGEARMGVGNLLGQASDHLKKRQTGTGRRRRRSVSAAPRRKAIKANDIPSSLYTLKGPTSAQKQKKVRIDSLGVY